MNATMLLISRKGLGKVLLAILVLGSLWGMSEIVFGGALRSTTFPYRSGLLTAIGFGVMGIGLAAVKRPAMLFGVGIVAALVSMMSVPLMHLAVTCKANSCLAVALEGTSLSMVAVFLAGRMQKSVNARIAGAAAAGILASLAFWGIGRYVAPCNYLLSFTTPGSFVAREGLVWAGFSAVLFPLGYMIGEKLAEPRAAETPVRATVRYYAAAAGVAVVALGSSVAATLAGF